MNIEEYREFCLSLPLVEETMPFDDVTLVYKVGNKIFTLANITLFERFSVKCDPELAIELRERYEWVKPGFHLNKKHWNDVYVNRAYADEFLKEQIVASYKLVINKSVTPVSLRKELQEIIKKV